MRNPPVFAASAISRAVHHKVACNMRRSAVKDILPTMTAMGTESDGEWPAAAGRRRTRRAGSDQQTVILRRCAPPENQLHLANRHFLKRKKISLDSALQWPPTFVRLLLQNPSLITMMTGNSISVEPFLLAKCC